MADRSGLQYKSGDIAGMISAQAVDETEVMQVTVTCKNPYEAERIANGIAKVLPQRIAEIVEGATMEVVDSAIVDTDKVAPSITLYTAVGFIAGMLLSVVTLIIIALMDNTIHDEEYILNNYSCPILAKIPDLTGEGHRKGYYSYYKKNLLN